MLDTILIRGIGANKPSRMPTTIPATIFSMSPIVLLSSKIFYCLPASGIDMAVRARIITLATQSLSP